MKVAEFTREQDFVQRSADILSDVFRDRSDVVRIALSGGSTPEKIYSAFGAHGDVAWDRLELYQVDERYVPRSDEESNYRMIDRSLVSAHREEIRGFFAFDTSLPIPESVEQYGNILNTNIDQGFDLCVLGVGKDGHIASLFPGSDALHSNDLVTHTTTDAFSVHDRLTLTFPMILGSKKILVLLRGEDKLRVLEELQIGGQRSDDFPAMRLLEHDDLTVHFCNCSL